MLQSHFSVQRAPFCLGDSKKERLSNPMKSFFSKKGSNAYLIAFLFYGLSNSIRLLAFSGDIFSYGIKALIAMCQGLALIMLVFSWCVVFLHSRKFSIVALILIGFSAILSMAAHNYVLFWMVSFSALGRVADMHKIVKTVFLLAVFTLACALVGLCLGILNNYTMIRQDGFIRYSCGFNHPNQAGCVVLAGCCSWAYTRWRVWGIADRLILIAAFAFTCIYLDSRTTALLLVVLIIVTELVNAFGERAWVQKAVPIAMLITIVFVIAATLAMMVFYDGEDPLFQSLNNALSGRPYYLNYYFENCPPGLFAQDLTNIRTEHDWGVGYWVTRGLLLDNAYGQLLFCYGWVQFCLFVAALLALPTLILFGHREFDVGLALSVPMMLYGLMESQMLIVTFSAFPILMITASANVLLENQDTGRD